MPQKTKKQIQEELDNALEENRQLQKRVIQLQDELLQSKPLQPDSDVNFHKTSGTTSETAIESDNIEQLQALQNWIFQFGNKYLRPYIHPIAYAETIAHMMRGIPHKMATLEVTQDISDAIFSKKTVPFPSSLTEKQPSTDSDSLPPQKPLLQDSDLETDSD